MIIPVIRKIVFFFWLLLGVFLRLEVSSIRVRIACVGIVLQCYRFFIPRYFSVPSVRSLFAFTVAYFGANRRVLSKDTRACE
jgi:hypothetical protein